MRDAGFQPGTLSSVVLWKDHIDLKKINWKNIPTKLSFSIFYYYSNLPRRVTDGLKYFRFWLRFSRVIQILGFKKTDLPGYDTPGRLTRRGIIPWGDWLTGVSYVPRRDWLTGVSYPRKIDSPGRVPYPGEIDSPGYHTPRRLKNSNNSMNS